MRGRNHHRHWHSDLNIFIIRVTHSYATSLTIPMKKILMITCKQFQDGRENISTSFELIFRAHHSMDAPSVAARGPMTDLDLETMWQGCPLFPQLFVIYLCHCFTGHYFYFKKLHSKLLISSGYSIILALKALCKVRGGPSWCLTAPAESDPVLPLGCTGLAALLISAEQQDL